MDELTCKDIIHSLTDVSRTENKRFEDMTTALRWLSMQLKYLKEQDKALMKKFNQIREQINDIKEGDEHYHERGQSLYNIHEATEEEFIEAKRCNLSPFDNEPNDGKFFRRRAFSDLQLDSRKEFAKVTFANEY